MDINLLPWRETQYTKSKKQFHLECSITFALLMLWFMACQYEQWSILKAQTVQIYGLEAKLKELSHPYLDAEYQQKIDQYNAVDDQLLNRLNNIISVLPNALYLTEIQKRKNSIDLIGKSPSQAEISDFLQRIETKTHQPTMVSETTHANDGLTEIEFHISDEIIKK